MKSLLSAIVLALLATLILFPLPARAAESQIELKDINFVFLHGAGSNALSQQLLTDTVREKLPDYIREYEQANPGIKVRADTLNRSYPNNVDIETWADNIIEGVNKEFPDKKNLVLVGHSFGGKAALYLASGKRGNFADRIAAVVTINTPVRGLDNYYTTGGVAIDDYLQARFLTFDRGIMDSTVHYDSSEDGKIVGSTKNWLALVSAEGAPLSNEFDFGGFDPMPRDMDDTIVPITAQYSEGADVVYYGEHGHHDFAHSEELSGKLAGNILDYLFGKPVAYSVLVDRGIVEHMADLMPGTDSWEDVTRETLSSSGRLEHRNGSFFKWQQWEDVVDARLLRGQRGDFEVSRKSLPFLTGVAEARWMTDDPQDTRLYIRTRAAPRSRVSVEWAVYESPLLPSGIQRDHYEVEVITGTPFTNIKRVSWASDRSQDFRLRISSAAESPFRWFRAEWRVYGKEVRQRNIIDELKGRVYTSPPEQWWLE